MEVNKEEYRRLCELAGRVEAVKDYAVNNDYASADIILSILGCAPKKEGEE